MAKDKDKELALADVMRPGAMEVIQKIMKEVADAIEQANMYTTISGKKYVEVDGWELLGTRLGLLAKIKEVRREELDDEIELVEFAIEKKGGGVKREIVPAWEEHIFRLSHPNAIQVRRWKERKYRYIAYGVLQTLDGREITTAEAECANFERNWMGRDSYAIRSMAQTRVVGKLYRLVLSYLMRLAGYEPTPAEEVPKEETHREPEPKPEVPSTELEAEFEKMVKFWPTPMRENWRRNFEATPQAVVNSMKRAIAEFSKLIREKPDAKLIDTPYGFRYARLVEKAKEIDETGYPCDPDHVPEEVLDLYEFEQKWFDFLSKETVQRNLTFRQFDVMNKLFDKVLKGGDNG